MLQECDIYSVEEDKWFKGPALNYPRANTVACPFDDRYIYMFFGKTLDTSTLIIEKLDTGIDGSSTALRSLDEDLTIPIDYKWEIIRLATPKDFIPNINFNGLCQVSQKDIIIFG